MKKIALVAMTLILLLTLAMPLSVAADESSETPETAATTAPTTASRQLAPNKVNVCVGAAAAKQGDLVEVPVTVETNPGVWSLTLNVHYDMSVLVLQSVTFSDEIKKNMAVLDIDNVTPSSDKKTFDSPFVLYTEGNSLTSNVTTTGLFATMTFLAIPGCELGDTEISITYKPNNVIDVDGNNVLVATHSGFVSVAKGKPSEPGVTYFPPRTRKNITTTKNDNGVLGGTSLLFIILGAVLIVGVVLAILVVRKPAPAAEKAVPAVPAQDDAKPAPDSKTEPESAEDDGIDDQA